LCGTNTSSFKNKKEKIKKKNTKVVFGETDITFVFQVLRFFLSNFFFFT
jgi:hypothetical protein